MASIYRRKKEEETWHFCFNCSHWPWRDFVESLTKPPAEKLCNECKTKLAEKNCD